MERSDPITSRLGRDGEGLTASSVSNPSQPTSSAPYVPAIKRWAMPTGLSRNKKGSVPCQSPECSTRSMTAVFAVGWRR